MERPRQNHLQWIENLGKHILEGIHGAGNAGLLFVEACVFVCVPPFRFKLFFKQMEFIGNKSLWITLLTGIFTGLVMTLQSYFALRQFSSETIVGGMVAVSMIRELGPVLTALMVNARAGSAIAAEIGTMRVTEQIDALQSLAVSPVQYLITPRILAGVVMLPVLTSIANMMGVVGSYLLAVGLLDVDSGIFMAKIRDFVVVRDIIGSMLKAAMFGVVLTFIGCYKGYNASNGAEGVGKATTEAVSFSAVFILLSDYIFTSFWQR
ncbi:MAG: ABC transporter permease [SAR324 cluster bacterium]|nr:ABC transporter permease [SAR324 cluster bacterium]